MSDTKPEVETKQEQAKQQKAQNQKENNKGNKNNKKQAKKDKKNKKKGNKKKPCTDPREFVDYRSQVWDELEKAQEAAKVEKPIKVTLPDGAVKEAVAFKDSPLDIANGISPALAQRVVIAKVDDNLWDLARPLEDDCKLELVDFKSEEGKKVFWHSSAHILGSSLEQEFGGKLCIGPPLEDGGFYYDIEMGDQKVSQEDFDNLEYHINQLVKQKHPFKRLVLKKEDAQRMFKYNPYKLEIINKKVPDGETCTAYRCGPLIDLCKGPHVVHTGKVKAIAVTKNSSAYWLGKKENDSLQRVYGISFPDKKQLKEWKKFMELAAERDHRKIGPDQKLFFFNDVSPGSAFFLPHGARIYNKLMDFIKGQYRERGFDEVMSPNIFNVDLWKTSGHYANYKDNLFLLDVEGQEFGMKPMNCPGHCMMFKYQLHSYRDLPLRYADFGVLHRNELSGALTGLTRVRRFQQDDAHIFCRADQIEQEVNGALDFLKFVYDKFGFEFSLCLSTRPEKFLGDVAIWDQAEKALENCLTRFCGDKWEFNHGDGAFYGPKIDILLTDALRRKHQCATIQLDFQLPIRFDLQYKGQDGSFQRPVIVHRAILGSVERMFAVLCEHTGGKWPMWLSPRQVMVVPVAPNYFEYAEKVRDQLHAAGFYADVDVSANQFKKKIRDSEIQQYNFTMVVGEKEAANNGVDIRGRGGAAIGAKTIEETIAYLNDLVTKYE